MNEREAKITTRRKYSERKRKKRINEEKTKKRKDKLIDQKQK